ncbi:MAG: acyl-CoA thioesterase II [Gammaproteobacteria bacterium]|nr:acyl-CoA thioesterase II [Gammaproteobacteria bacterium]NNF62086.1 acyl-CoA thioesterase II [Gammaproteobacteria bacterium]NNM20470.1 acyl-CoA thioesterase II [Gammaproteobacteria bacterium]
MTGALEDLIKLLRLERLEKNLFRGQSRDIGSPRVFGGQVLGQALSAAQQTVEGRRVHSLHAYFLRAGDVNAPIVYDVDRSRDGRTFTSRRVVAIQHGQQIFHLAASFQLPEEGFEHQDEMPDVPGPEELADASSYHPEGEVPDKLSRFMSRQRPFEFRPVQTPAFLTEEKAPPRQQFWFRTTAAVADEHGLHTTLLSYVSDYGLIGTATMPHGISFPKGNVQLASLDHAMWFHRHARIDDWLLYDCDSPSASGARGLARGQVYARDGRLVASTAQEGLIRVWSLQEMRRQRNES